MVDKHTVFRMMAKPGDRQLSVMRKRPMFLKRESYIKRGGGLVEFEIIGIVLGMMAGGKLLQ